MPFNWRAPFGYAIVLILQVADVSTVLYCATLLFAFFIGSCWLCIVFVNDVANDLNLLNFGNSNNSTDRLMKERFFNVVQFYCDVKRLSMNLDIHRFWSTGVPLFPHDSLPSYPIFICIFFHSDLGICLIELKNLRLSVTMMMNYQII